MDSEQVRTASKEELDLILGFFARVDAKSSVLLAVDTGMLAVLASNAPPLRDLSSTMIASSASTLLFLAATIWFLFREAFPHLKGGQASLVYFREVASRTEHKFIEEFKGQTADQHTNDLLGQAWRNSEILKAKFGALKIAFILLAIAIVPWVVSLALFAAYNSHIHSKPFN